MKVAILCNGFTGWGGGVDFIRYIASSVASVEGVSQYKRHILILPSNPLLTSWKRFLPSPTKIFGKLAVVPLQQRHSEPNFSEDYLRKTFSDFRPYFEIITGGANIKSQLSAARKARADVVLPCIEPLDSHCQLPWVGYLYDFQHMYLPELFLPDEIHVRNRAFSRMLNSASNVIVNSKSVSKDAEKFYTEFTANVHAIPFSPCPQKSWLTNDLDVRDKYGIDKPFFMLCNQFWLHKDHSTAFRAFAHFLQSKNDAVMVCTGQTTDYRSPAYFSQLKQLISDLGISSRVRILGHIPKIDQVSLLKNALGLIQPTLFEGGPGGGATYDAISLGVPVIASDITVNQEINCGDVTLFHAGDDNSLADALIARGTRTRPRPTAECLWEQGLSRRRHCGNFILNVAKLALEGN